ncbi:hypothetical protein Nepgr_000046 [Nepenthes gracilis]|uniref:Cation/H+ exchanger domain-containing protein n=1 Tax=Nepenthes gracilis TaxID=150966 RepID=A0AAD3P5S6_NEPGR|nr:hypothetical protein Nepgr_000046 [Nepenthes gracilis]
MSATLSNQTIANNCISLAPWVTSLPDFPLAIFQLQLLVVFCVTQMLHLLIFKHLGMPPLVSQVYAGILLGPSGLGQFKSIHEKIFPPLSSSVWKCVAMLSYSFTMFMVSVKMDFGIMRRTGRKAYAIGLLALCSTLMTTSITKSFLQKNVNEISDLSFGSTILTVTSFPVIACLISDLGLLNSELGRLALSSALAAEIASISVMFFNNNFLPVLAGTRTLLTACLYVSGVVLLIIVVVFVIRPFMRWMIRETPQGRPVKDTYVLISFLIMLLGELFTDISGQYVLLGAYIIGAGVPDGPPLGATLVEKFDVFITGILEPFFISSCTMRTNLSTVSFESNITRTIVIVFVVVIVTKITVCFLCGVYNNMVFQDAIAIALILCHKGSIDIASYTWFRDFNIISEECFSALTLCATFAATVMPFAAKRLYNPLKKYAGYQRRNIMHCKPNSDLRVLACILRPDNVAAVINLLNVSSPTKESPIVVYVLHIMKLIGRSHPVFISHDMQKKKVSHHSYSDELLWAFNRFEHSNKDVISVHAYTAVSPSEAMHDDICTLALDKLVSVIVLPFHRKFGFEGSVDVEDYDQRMLNNSILLRAPCSVAILVDRGNYRRSSSNPNSISILSSEALFSVAVIFIGGNDDREALAYANRMRRGNRIKLTVIRLVAQGDEGELRPLDAAALREFREMGGEGNKEFRYKEEVTRDGAETALRLRSMVGDYNLIVVGRRYNLDSPQTSGLMEWVEIRELGIIGDLLSSPDLHCKTSILVVQQQQQWIR